MAAAQRDELTALNAKAEVLTARADTTNDRLTDLVKSTTPHWVFFLTLVAAVTGILVSIWLAQPSPTAPASAAAPILTPAGSPSP